MHMGPWCTQCRPDSFPGGVSGFSPGSMLLFANILKFGEAVDEIPVHGPPLISSWKVLEVFLVDLIRSQDNSEGGRYVASFLPSLTSCVLVRAGQRILRRLVGGQEKNDDPITSGKEVMSRIMENGFMKVGI
jgi:hypothetical protein